MAKFKTLQASVFLASLHIWRFPTVRNFGKCPIPTPVYNLQSYSLGNVFQKRFRILYELLVKREVIQPFDLDDR